MLSFEDEILMINLWECKRFSVRRLLKEFPKKKWKLLNNIGSPLRRIPAVEE